MPGDGGRRTERREKVKKRRENEEEERSGVAFQVRRVTGHDATAIPPTVLPLALLEDEEDVLALKSCMLCLHNFWFYLL